METENEYTKSLVIGQHVEIKPLDEIPACSETIMFLIVMVNSNVFITQKNGRSWI